MIPERHLRESLILERVVNIGPQRLNVAEFIWNLVESFTLGPENT